MLANKLFSGASIILKEAKSRHFSFSPLLLKPNDKNENAVNVVYDFDPDERTENISVETSIRYMKSKAYQTTYGTDPVWTHYRRNKTRHFEHKTRTNCIKDNKINTASPCPICRDKYLVIHYKNAELLKQFISPYGGEILPTTKTRLCQRQHLYLQAAILKAKDHGIITYEVPFRIYDYSYYKGTDNPCDSTLKKD